MAAALTEVRTVTALTVLATLGAVVAPTFLAAGINSALVVVNSTMVAGDEVFSAAEDFTAVTTGMLVVATSAVACTPDAHRATASHQRPSTIPGGLSHPVCSGIPAPSETRSGIRLAAAGSAPSADRAVRPPLAATEDGARSETVRMLLRRREVSRALGRGAVGEVGVAKLNGRQRTDLDGARFREVQRLDGNQAGSPIRERSLGPGREKEVLQFPPIECFRTSKLDLAIRLREDLNLPIHDLDRGHGLSAVQDSEIAADFTVVRGASAMGNFGPVMMEADIHFCRICSVWRGILEVWPCAV